MNQCKFCKASDEIIKADEPVQITRKQFWSAVRDSLEEQALENGRTLQFESPVGARRVSLQDLFNYPVAKIAQKLGLMEERQ